MLRENFISEEMTQEKSILKELFGNKVVFPSKAPLQHSYRLVGEEIDLTTIWWY